MSIARSGRLAKPATTYRPLPTFRLTLALFLSLAPAFGYCLRTRPFIEALECSDATLPMRQWRFLIFAFAAASFCPSTFGTRHFGATGGGGGGGGVRGDEQEHSDRSGGGASPMGGRVRRCHHQPSLVA